MSHMDYYEKFKEENLEIRERFDLAMERIGKIPSEHTTEPPYREYFSKTAGFIMKIETLVLAAERKELQDYSMSMLQELNSSLYEDISTSNYEKSYANPAYAVSMLGEECGALLCFLYAEIRGMIVYAFEGRITDITILAELFIEIYNCFEEENITYDKLKDIIYWFMSDNSDITLTYRVREQLDPDLSFAADIIMKSDLEDLRYLYYFGEYITETELKTAEYLNGLTQEQIDAMASTYTEGYRIGFVKGNKDLAKKKTVNIRFCIGFERMVKAAIIQFEKMGLQPVLYRAAVNSMNKRQHFKVGYYAASSNKQYDYDHKADNAIYLDKAFSERKLGVLKTAYEQYKKLANGFAGPACIDIFGEIPFIPVNKKEAFRLSDKQQKLSVEYDNASAQIINEYIKGEERSFTIIAYPIPDIGESFEEIFDEIVKINTLDYKLYENIQQKLIDALDKGDYAVIKGSGKNETNLSVSLLPIANPENETRFENCVADVNIPVGEVFTSPLLKGTTGLLHVTEVYLNYLKYVDLKIWFEDGMIKDYLCSNFESEEENKKYIKENILHNHETLPIGEFAIGTNTAAYVVGEKYRIAGKYPILIAEKTGPHFAVGDTCFSWSEENRVYNPDGKEMIAKDNEISRLRKEDVSKAYYNCHTDITIPYKELLEISVEDSGGNKIEVIKNGKFVLPGTEKLNEAFERI